MISATGLGSGIDVDSLVSQLVAAEGNAKTVLLSNRRSDAQAQISAYGSIKSALAEFQSALEKLQSTDAYTARTAKSENTDYFTVTSTNNAAIGTYDIEVQQLAKSQKLSSTGFAAETSVVGTGSLTINVGSSTFNIDIDAENNTVEKIRDAINSSLANSGINATTINVDNGSGGTETRLVLTSENPGEDNEISITVTDDDANNTDTSGLSALVYDPTGSAVTNMTQLSPAQDAIIKVDNLTVTRSSNSLDDVIADITIELVAADPGNTHELNISEGTPSIIGSLEKFVTEYNKLNSTLNELSAFNTETSSGAILIGDFTLRGIENQLKRYISDEVSGQIGTIRSLVNLGVTSNDDGSLSFDSEVLTDALELDPAGVESFFTSDTGFANRLDDLLDGFVGSGQLLDSKTDSLNTQIESIDDDLEDLNTRLQTMEERLLAQFSALDGLIAQLNTTSSFLANALSSTGVSSSS